MAPGKLICSSNRASSPENDHERDEKSTEDNIGVGRTYECSFCKRGFTNAQALGGHMNIHRKDKAKTKQAKKNQEEQHPSMMATRSDNYSNLMYNFPHDLIHSFDHHHHQFLYLQRLNYYMSVGREQAKYKMYLPQSNPNNTVLQSANVHALRQGRLYDHDEDLSLKIGLMPYIEVNDDIGISQRSENAHDQVDLELRLGHNPK